MNPLRTTWILLAVLPLATAAASTIDPAHRFAYAANAGWIDWRADGTNGAVIGQYVCSGLLYSANAGWIDLGSGQPRDGVRYSNASARDFGVNHDGAGNLQGCAWGPNIGWVYFTNRTTAGTPFAGPSVDLLTGKLSGYAWSGNLGWISLSNSLASVRTTRLSTGPDTDDDGIADAWELERFGNLETAGADSDFDGDGSSDRDEFLAGFDPRQPESKLEVKTPRAISAGEEVSLTWPSRPDRQYRILTADNLGSNARWSDAGLGFIDPDAGGSTTRSVRSSPTSSRFFRIEAVNPLWP